MATKTTKVIIQGKETVSRASKKAGASLKNFAKTVLSSKLSIAALGAAAIFAVKDFAEFEKAMVDVGNLSNASREEVAKLSKEVINLSKTAPQSANDLAKALFDVQSAGVDASKSIKFLEQATKLATGGVTDIKTAVDGLTTVINAYSLSADDAAMISDKLFMAQVQGKTTVGELSSAIGRIAPSAYAAGLSLDELLSAIASLTAQGINTNEAVTSLKATISAITGPSEQAKKAAESYGIELSQSAIKAKGLEGVLREIITATKGDIGALKELLGSQEAVNAAVALGKNDFDKLSKSIDKVTESTGSAAKANAEQLDTLSAQWSIFTNNIMSGSKGLGNAIAKILKPILKVTNGLISANDSAKDYWENLNNYESKSMDQLNQDLSVANHLLETGTLISKDAATSRIESIQAEMDKRKEASEANTALITKELDDELAAKETLLEAETDEMEAKKERILEFKEFMDEQNIIHDEEEVERYANSLSLEELTNTSKLNLLKKFYEKKKELQAKDLTADKILSKHLIENSKAMTDILSGNQGDVAESAVKFAKLAANTVIDTIVAQEVAKATTSAPMSFGATLAAIAPIIAAGAAGKAAINAIFHQGGIVGQDDGTATGSSVGVAGSENLQADERIAKLQTGEEVLSRAERSELIELMRDIKEGGIGGNLPTINVMIELDGDLLGEQIIDLQSQVRKGIV